MKIKTFIGIDNGVTGTIGIINGAKGAFFSKIPTIKQQNYTKKKQGITRVDVSALSSILVSNIEDVNNSYCLIERPMVNPTRFTSTISAVRALEAVLTLVEFFKIPYGYVDSKAWQKMLLPIGVKGNALKKASHDIGIRLFPQYQELIGKHKDADGILIAEYARKQG